jgi:hypothetical protein
MILKRTWEKVQCLGKNSSSSGRAPERDKPLGVIAKSQPTLLRSWFGCVFPRTQTRKTV